MWLSVALLAPKSTTSMPRHLGIWASPLLPSQPANPKLAVVPPHALCQAASPGHATLLSVYCLSLLCARILSAYLVGTVQLQSLEECLYPILLPLSSPENIPDSLRKDKGLLECPDCQKPSFPGCLHPFRQVSLLDGKCEAWPLARSLAGGCR